LADSNTPTMLTSEKTVTSAGTAVALHAAQRVKSVTIVAKISNTGQVYVGGSDVASATNDGMAPGDSLSIPAENWLDLNDLYVDSDVNGEGVDFWAVKA